MDANSYAQQLLMTLLDKLPKVEIVLTYDEVMLCGLGMRREFKARIEERQDNPVGRAEDTQAFMSFSDVYGDVADALQRASDYMHMNEITKTVVGLPFTLYAVLKDAMKTPLNAEQADQLAGSSTTKDLIAGMSANQHEKLQEELNKLQASTNDALTKAGMSFFNNDAIPKEMSEKLASQLAANDNQPSCCAKKPNEHLN